MNYLIITSSKKCLSKGEILVDIFTNYLLHIFFKMASNGTNQHQVASNWIYRGHSITYEEFLPKNLT